VFKRSGRDAPAYFRGAAKHDRRQNCLRKNPTPAAAPVRSPPLQPNAGQKRAAANDNPQITATTVGNSGAKDGYADMDPDAEMDFFRKLAGRG